MHMRLLLIPALVLSASTASAQNLEQLARSSLSQIDGNVPLRGLRDYVEVIRDRWGVPHIYARNVDDLFFAQGFVQAQDRLWQMEMYRRTHEGALSEILGPSHVAHDRMARLIRYRGPMDDTEWKSYHPDGRRIFDAFANGVNAYITQAGDRLPVEFRVTGLRPKPWTAEIALLRTQTAMPIGDAREELELARNVARLGADSANRAARPLPYRDLVVPRGVDYSIIGTDVIDALRALRGGTVRPDLLPRFSTGANENRGVQEDSPGSNNWVTSARLSANGHVVIANDPHRNVSNPSIRYIVHLNAPGWDVIGATEPMFPGVMIGHTGRIGWGLTVVGIDQTDVYMEEVNPANPDQVRFRGQWEAMRVVLDTIVVKGSAPVVVRHKFTRHGPVFFEDTVRHRAYAMRSTAHLPGSAGYLSALRYHALEDCTQFLAAQRYFLAPSENMICGDTKGNIAWQASGAAPKRPNWDGRLPVPGTGEYEWDGLRSDHPRELNPERGWIATANHNIHPPGFDPPLFFTQQSVETRINRLRDVLSVAKGLTLADHAALQHDAFSAQGLADTRLFKGWSDSDPAVEWARAQLASWNGQARRESAAAALYRYMRNSITDDTRALTGMKLLPEMERLIRMAMDSLRAKQGPDRSQWRWGRINRSEMPHALAREFDIPAIERHGGAGFVAAVGATFREVIDINDPDASLVTNVPGQSGQPFSPFYQNLVDSYGRGEYFPLTYTRAAVEKAAAHRLTLTPAR